MKSRVLAILAVLLFLVIGFVGCMPVSQLTANTTVTYKDGKGKEFFYSSNKNQEGLDAHGDFDTDGNIKGLSVKTTATTPEAAIAAALQSNIALQAQVGQLLQSVLPLIQSAAQGALAGGGPGAGAAVVGRVLTAPRVQGGSNAAPSTPVPAPAPDTANPAPVVR